MYILPYMKTDFQKTKKKIMYFKGEDNTMSKCVYS